MKSSRNWVVTGIYLLILAGYLAGSFWLLNYLNALTQRTFNPSPYIWGGTAIFILFGVLLGFDHICGQMKMRGEWKVNIAKLLLLGLPAACLTAGRIVAFTAGTTILPPFVFSFMAMNSYTPAAVCILLGFAVTSSFYKVPPVNIQ